jgi:hypothetical protein
MDALIRARNFDELPESHQLTLGWRNGMKKSTQLQLPQSFGSVEKPSVSLSLIACRAALIRL